MIFAIIAAWLGYKRATENGRSGVLWAAVTGGAFVGTQLAVYLGAGVFIGLGVGLWGWSETAYETYNLLITAIAVVASIAVAMLILRYLNRVPEDNNFVAPPPPPPANFN